MVFGDLATSCGYSFETIRAMTLHDYRRLRRYWSEHAPTHMAIAAGAGGGYKLEREKTLEEKWAEGAMGPEDFHRYVQMTGGKLPGPTRH